MSHPPMTMEGAVSGLSTDVRDAVRRHRRLFYATAFVALGFGLAYADSPRPPAELAGLIIYLGSFVTLYLCMRLQPDAFRDLGAGAVADGTTPLGVYAHRFALVLGASTVARVVAALALAPSQLRVGPAVLAAPLLMGVPLDVLLIAMALTLNAMLGRESRFAAGCSARGSLTSARYRAISRFRTAAPARSAPTAACNTVLTRPPWRESPSLIPGKLLG